MTISYVHDIKTSGQNEGVLTIIVEANVAYHAHVASCAITNPQLKQQNIFSSLIYNDCICQNEAKENKIHMDENKV